jgi:predicted ester cyclase
VTMSTDTRPAVDTLAHLAGRFVREHNQPEYLASHEALLAPDAVVHEYLPGLPDSLDRAGYAGFIAMFRSALPDVANTVEDVVVANDRAVVRWIGGGTHTGAPLLGRPATGRRVQAHGVYVLRFAGARIAEVWNHWDNLNVLGQLGTPGEAEKEVVRRFFAANDQQRLDLMPTLVAEDLVMHSSVPVPAAGREGLLQLLHGLRAAFPTQRTEIHRLGRRGRCGGGAAHAPRRPRRPVHGRSGHRPGGRRDGAGDVPLRRRQDRRVLAPGRPLRPARSARRPPGGRRR